jgi:hypothetical protein
LRRSVRYPGARDVDPYAAVEAAVDPDGLVTRDSSSRTREAILVVGYAPTADDVLVVVLLPDNHPPARLWHVVTAWPADRRRRLLDWGGPMTPTDRTLREKVDLEAQDADASRGANLHYRRKKTSNGQSVVYGLRLPADRIEQLQRLAAARGIEPSALVRQWIIAQLDAAGHGIRDRGAERWERDLRATTAHLRRLLDERPGA